MSKKDALKGLYVLTDATLTPQATIFSQMERVLKMGVSVIQFRDKYASDEDAYFTCKTLQELCNRYNALFIIDDRLELARNVNADGLHIGQDDVSYEEARSLLGVEKIIGISCYGDLERAKRYESLGADYVAFGSFFPSPTKPHSSVVPLDILHEAKKHISVPICAIGGINQENIHLVAKSNIEMYSVISAVFKNDTIEENLLNLQKAMQ